MSTPADFMPVNRLESLLLQAQRGEATVEALLDTLLASQVFVLLDKDPGPGSVWNNTASPLVLGNASGSPVLAVFTDRERSTRLRQQVPGYEFGLLVQFRWLVLGIANDVGAVINPGNAVGFELSPERVAELKSRAPSCAAAG
jgi:hypothetical protein